jgi:hypothetical protein
MSDNTQLSSAVGTGDVIRDKDRAGVKTQIVGIDTNPAGSESLMAGSMPISAVVGTLADRSGTLTTGGTSQQLAAANTTRKYLLIQNVSTTDLWINFTTAAVVGQPSIKVVAGGNFVMESSFVSNEAVNIIGPTTGQAFTAKEG